MSLSTQVKRWVKKTTGSNNVRVRTVKGKNGWIQVWLPSSEDDKPQDVEFSVEVRKMMLLVVYGADFESKSGCWIAGNVGNHGVSMLPHHWKTIIES